MDKKSPNRSSNNAVAHCGPRFRFAAGGLLLIALCSGCDRGPQVAPARGAVRLDGKPLEFGTVTFQPTSGQAARAEIQADGSFVLSTRREGDGAYVGLHKVRITCYESQSPAAKTARSGGGEASLGKLLIPRRYTFFDQSGLSAEVVARGENQFAFELDSEK